MAPLPPNTTARLYVDYETCTVQHTSVIRYNTGSTWGDAQIEWNDVVEAIDESFYLINILGARVQDAGTDFTYPVTWIQQPTYGTDAGPKNAGANMCNFIGRSNTGHRGGLFLFGYLASVVGAKYRVPEASNAGVAAALVELRAAEGTMCAVDGAPMVWQNYANIGESAYWRNKIR